MKETVILKQHHLSFSNFCCWCCFSACACVRACLSFSRSAYVYVCVCDFVCLPVCHSLRCLQHFSIAYTMGRYFFGAWRFNVFVFRVFMSKKILNINILLFEDKKCCVQSFAQFYPFSVRVMLNACADITWYGYLILQYIFLRIRLTCTHARTAHTHTYPFSRISKAKQLNTPRHKEFCRYTWQTLV